MRLGLVLAGIAACCASAAGAASDGFERDVLAGINFARAHPQAAASALRRYRDAFDGRVVHEDGDAAGVMTAEGTAAVDEAIAFLERQPSLPPLADGADLARAATGWAAEQGPAGGTGHDPALGVRLRTAGGDGYLGEAISYGMRGPAAVVRQLIVDDGVPGRGHRALLFSHDFRYAGVGCGGHARYGSMCVVDLAATLRRAAALPQLAAATLPRN